MILALDPSPHSTLGCCSLLTHGPFQSTQLSVQCPNRSQAGLHGECVCLPTLSGARWMGWGAQTAGLGPVAVVTLAAAAEELLLMGKLSPAAALPQLCCTPRGSGTSCMCHSPGCPLHLCWAGLKDLLQAR